MLIADSFAGRAHVAWERTGRRDVELARTGLARAELDGTGPDHIEPEHDLAERTCWRHVDGEHSN